MSLNFMATNSVQGKTDKVMLHPSDVGEYRFRLAGWLDIPFIFELLLEGSKTGVFAERFLNPKGYREIFWLLFTRLGLTKWRCSKPKHEMLIFMHANQNIGFINISSEERADYPSTKIIELCALLPQHRGKGEGEKMIRLFVESLDKNTLVLAYYTKYALEPIPVGRWHAK